MPPGTWLNLVLPGAGLLLRGRLGLGLGLLLPALGLLTALALIHLVATSTVLGGWRLSVLAIYALLAGLAAATHAVLLYERPLDAVAVRALHRQIATAYLSDKPSEALADAHRLTVLAAHEPGAWRLLALVTENSRQAAKARRRAARLDREREG